MDQNSVKGSDVPVQTTSPEEDSTLLAIEALEARTVDPNPRPLNDPREVPIPPRVAPTASTVPVKVMEPVLPKVVTPPIVVKPVPIEAAPVLAAPTKPKKPPTPSEAIADELAHAPITKGFQFFLHQKAPRKPFIVIGGIIVVVGIGVAAYFSLR